MRLRADHVAGGLFILAGVGIFAASGDLPFGSLSFPGAGFMPMILAALLILMGGLLALGARESIAFGDIDWGDLPHAAAVVAITLAATVLYDRVGFILTLPLLLFALLAFVERKNVVVAAAFSVMVTVAAYALFNNVLHAPVPRGPLGF